MDNTKIDNPQFYDVDNANKSSDQCIQQQKKDITLIQCFKIVVSKEEIHNDMNHVSRLIRNC